MKMEDGPTPETSAAWTVELLKHEREEVGVLKFYRDKAIAERDEARDKLAMLEKAIADLSHPNIRDALRQRDRLLEALETAVSAHAFDHAWKHQARAAIAEVKGGR